MADKIDTWPSEIIPDSDALYMRAHKCFFQNQSLQPGVFRDHGGTMSTDWSKYSSPEKTQFRSKVPDDNSVIAFEAGCARDIGLEVTHTPDHDLKNRSHTDVVGTKTPKVRVILLRNCNVVLHGKSISTQPPGSCLQ